MPGPLNTQPAPPGYYRNPDPNRSQLMPIMSGPQVVTNLATGETQPAVLGGQAGNGNMQVDFSNIGNPYTKSSSTSRSGLPSDFLDIIRGVAPGLMDTTALTTSIERLLNMPSYMVDIGNQIGGSWGGSWAQPLQLPAGLAPPAPAPEPTPVNQGGGNFLSGLLGRLFGGR
jgi:hypothetical protein